MPSRCLLRVPRFALPVSLKPYVQSLFSVNLLCSEYGTVISSSHSLPARIWKSLACHIFNVRGLLAVVSVLTNAQAVFWDEVKFPQTFF